MPQRTHTCGELRREDIGKQVVLEGWVAHRRDHGGVVFVDLRDRYGLTQVVFRPNTHPEAHELADGLRSEYVIRVRGEVEPRLEGQENPKLTTGAIEIDGQKLEILNTATPPPFDLDVSDTDTGETTRLKLRYLDLRRPRMQRNIRMRHRMWKAVRDYYDSEGFYEIETPFLTKSTPEGARDYLVPSRIEPGHFYALPQSPQLFKQILMISGFDKYFQIVRCFRDEDTRANRQPEFTQLDVEMSFASEDDVIDNSERLMQRLMKVVLDREVTVPFPRLTYAEAMSRYGCDAPDTRFAVELTDISEEASQSEFKVFTSVVASGGQVRAICAPGGASLSRKEIDDLTKVVADFGAKGLAWFKVEEGKLTSQLAKFFSEDLQKRIIARTGANPGDLLLCVADKPSVTSASLAALRLVIGKRLKLIDETVFNLVWVVDFPLFFWNEEEKRCDSPHHPFTSPRPEDESLMDTEPLKVKSRAYDLVLNGTEIAGGSIRIHRSGLQSKVFDLLGISKEEAELRFGFFLRALEYGAPPHGGIAWGLERTLMLFLGEQSLREVIPFPKTQRGQCLLTDAPSEVDPKQLRELGIRIDRE
ncbi:MAG TPA: aspartate--tRNA ligase [Planctomycetota bacterium]|nr:aspartate--tRNA ligase [Planctomycetota bacterium]